MTISATIDAIQAVNLAISGVNSAPNHDAMPAELVSEQLPCAITFPGPGDWSAAGGLGGGRKCLRTYVVRVFVTPIEPGDTAADLAEGYTLLEAFGVKWRATQLVGGEPVWTRQGGITDSGMLGTVRYAGREYFGFEVRIPILETA